MEAGASGRAQIERAVKQNAATSSLLGVEYVPCFRSIGGPAGGAASAAAGAAGPRGGGGAPAIVVNGQTELIPPARTDWHLVDERRAAAQRALDEIRARYERDAPHQHFVTAHSNIVFGEGDPCARLMFIGEAPGADEDRTGRPFVGRAGQLLARMILAMGLNRQSVYIANVLKTRPPNNATPTLDEAERCSPYLFDQILAVRPEAIVTLGLPATRLVLKTDLSMGELRGRWSEWRHPDASKGDGFSVSVMPTFHPAFLLRQYTSENRAKVWSDLRSALVKLGLPVPGK